MSECLKKRSWRSARLAFLMVDTAAMVESCVHSAFNAPQAISSFNSKSRKKEKLKVI